MAAVPSPVAEASFRGDAQCQIFLTQLGAPPPGCVDVDMMNCECLGEIGIAQLDWQQGFWPYIQEFEQSRVFDVMSEPRAVDNPVESTTEKAFVTARRRLSRRCLSSPFMRSDAPTAGALQIANSWRDLIFDDGERDRFNVNAFETKNLQYFQRLIFDLG